MSNLDNVPKGKILFRMSFHSYIGYERVTAIISWSSKFSQLSGTPRRNQFPMTKVASWFCRGCATIQLCFGQRGEAFYIIILYSIISYDIILYCNTGLPWVVFHILREDTTCSLVCPLVLILHVARPGQYESWEVQMCSTLSSASCSSGGYQDNSQSQ